MQKREIADSTQLDHNLNQAYKMYYETWGNWWNPSVKVKATYQDVPSFAQFVASLEDGRVGP